MVSFSKSICSPLKSTEKKRRSSDQSSKVQHEDPLPGLHPYRHEAALGILSIRAVRDSKDTLVQSGQPSAILHGSQGPPIRKLPVLGRGMDTPMPWTYPERHATFQNFHLSDVVG